MSKSKRNQAKTDPDITRFILHHSDLILSDQILGQGASGTVYVGTYKKNGIKVAIKQIHNESSERSVEFYEREAKNLATLTHHFLLPFVGYTLTPPYSIVTRYIENGSLYSALREDPNHLNLSPTDLTFIAYGIADGMEYLHSKEVIHRDLKTQNILLDHNKSPIIADFGSSKSLSLSGPKTGLMGTPNYMAPEFLRTDPYNQSVDVYSFGVILWEMITRQTPFGQLEPIQMVYCIGMGKETLEIPGETPEPLYKLISSCLSSQPDMRPSFTDIRAQFESLSVVFAGTDVQLLSSLISSIKSSNSNQHNHQSSSNPQILNSNANQTFNLHSSSNPVMNINAYGNNSQKSSTRAQPKIPNMNSNYQINTNFGMNSNMMNSNNAINPNNAININAGMNAVPTKQQGKPLYIPIESMNMINDGFEKDNRVNGKNYQKDLFDLSNPTSRNCLPPPGIRANSIQPISESSFDINKQLSKKTPQQVATEMTLFLQLGKNENVAFDFFEKYSNDSGLLTANLWEDFLSLSQSYIAKEKPIEQCNRLSKLLVSFAEHQESLELIKKVPHLESFVNPNNLDFFLFVVTFLPSVITPSLVSSIASLALSSRFASSHSTDFSEAFSDFSDLNTGMHSSKSIPDDLDSFFHPRSSNQSSNVELGYTNSPLSSEITGTRSSVSTSKPMRTVQKALSLLVKIYQSSQNLQNIQNFIITFFQQHVSDYVNCEGGDLIIRLLQSEKLLQNDIISLYGTSIVPLNVIAAYDCLYASEGEPELFTLPAVLSHFASEDSELRNKALEFIRKFAAKARGEPLEQIIEALITTVLRFSSEKAELLLCRIANTNANVLLQKKYSELWLQVSPQKAHLLVSLFMVVFSKCGMELLTNEDAAAFLSAALESMDQNAFLAVCWILGRAQITTELASLLDDHDVIDLIVKRLCESHNHEIIICADTALSKLAPLYYSPMYIDAIKHLLNLIKEKNETAGNCIITLSYLSLQPETHQTFREENVAAILQDYNSVYELFPYITRIAENLKDSLI